MVLPRAYNIATMKTKWRQLSILFFIVLVLILLGLPIAGCNQAPAPTVTATTTSTQTVTSTPTSTTTSTTTTPPTPSVKPEPILQPETWPTYLNNDDGYSIQYPSTWKPSENSVKGSEDYYTLVLIKGPKSSSIEISPYKDNGQTLSSWVDSFIETHTKLFGSQFLSRTSLVWQGVYEACELTEISWSSNQLLKYKLLIVRCGDYFYTVYGHANESEYDSYSSTFDAIMNSFRLTPPTPSPTIEISDLVKKVAPAVVRVVTDKGMGSGIIIDTQGYILTNNHVVEGSQSIKVCVWHYKRGPDLEKTAIKKGTTLITKT
jgi:hypothetical protein